ncbi:MAG: hypothetical protein IPL78_35615 [Chloroflexi bacterium]|nr:hypothetical protein [Chloroflexota bacterium]
MWVAETGLELALFAGHSDVVYSASFSPDGSQVVTSSEDGTARIYAVLVYASLEAMMAEVHSD